LLLFVVCCCLKTFFLNQKIVSRKSSCLFWRKGRFFKGESLYFVSMRQTGKPLTEWFFGGLLLGLYVAHISCDPSKMGRLGGNLLEFCPNPEETWRLHATKLASPYDRVMLNPVGQRAQKQVYVK
jgi:hypothetical protein